MSAEILRFPKINPNSYEAFMQEHSPDDEEEYVRAKIDALLSGESIWMRRNFDSDSGVVFDLISKQTHIGYIDFEDGIADAYKIDKTGHGSLIGTFDSLCRPRNFTDAKMQLDAFVEADKLFEDAHVLYSGDFPPYNSDSLWEKEAAMYANKDPYNHDFLIDEIPEEPDTFSAAYFKGGEKLGKVEYSAGLADVFALDAHTEQEIQLNLDGPTTLAKAIFDLKQFFEEQ